MQIKKFSVKLPSGTGTTPLIDTGIVTITGSCSGGTATISAVKDSGPPATALNSESISTSNQAVSSNGFSNLTGSTNLTASPANTIGHLVAVTTTGSQVTADYMARDSGNFGGEPVCVFGGTVQFG